MKRSIELTASSIRHIKHVQCVSNEYQNITHYMVSDAENNKNLSQYLAKKAMYESFKTSIN